MDHEDSQPHVTLDGQSDLPRKHDREARADRAADAATALYATQEHEERKRRFEIALDRASNAQ